MANSKRTLDRKIKSYTDLLRKTQEASEELNGLAAKMLMETATSQVTRNSAAVTEKIQELGNLVADTKADSMGLKKILDKYS